MANPNVYQYTLLLNSTNCIYPDGKHVAIWHFPLDLPLHLSHGADYFAAIGFLQMSMTNVLLPLKYWIKGG